MHTLPLPEVTNRQTTKTEYRRSNLHSAQIAPRPSNFAPRASAHSLQKSKLETRNSKLGSAELSHRVSSSSLQSRKFETGNSKPGGAQLPPPVSNFGFRFSVERPRRSAQQFQSLPNIDEAFRAGALQSRAPRHRPAIVARGDVKQFAEWLGTKPPHSIRSIVDIPQLPATPQRLLGDTGYGTRVTAHGTGSSALGIRDLKIGIRDFGLALRNRPSLEVAVRIWQLGTSDLQSRIPIPEIPVPCPVSRVPCPVSRIPCPETRF